VLIFLFQYKVHILRLIVEHNIWQMSPTTLLSCGGWQCVHFISCALVGTPHILIIFFLYLGPFKPIHKKETIIVLQWCLSPFTIITSMLQGVLQLINVLTRLCETTLHAMKNGQGCCYLSTVSA